MKNNSGEKKNESKYDGIEPEIIEMLKDNEGKNFEETKNNSDIENIVNERRESWGLNNSAITPDKLKGNLVYIVGHANELKKIHLAMKWKINENKSIFYKTASAAVDFFKINIFGKNYTIDQIMGMEENHLSEINSTLILMTSNLKVAYKNLINSRNKDSINVGASVSNNKQLKDDLFKVERDYNILKRKLLTMHPGDEFYFKINRLYENVERKRSELLQGLHLNQVGIIDYTVGDNGLKKLEKIVQVYLFLSEELIDKTKRVLNFTRVTRPLYDPLNKQTETVKLLLKNVHYLGEYRSDVIGIIGNRLRKIAQIEKDPRSLSKRDIDSNQVLESILNDLADSYDMKIVTTDRIANNYLGGR